jgi:hypothetical protein
MANFLTSHPCIPPYWDDVKLVSNSSTTLEIRQLRMVFIPSVGLIGVTCNLVNIFVLSTFMARSCFHRLLFFLAMFDTLSLLSLLTAWLMVAMDTSIDLCSGPSTKVLLKCLLWAQMFLVDGGSWMALAISLERYLGICWPLRYPARYRKARHFVLSVLLLTLLDTVILFNFKKYRFTLHAIPCHVIVILLLVFLNSSIVMTMVKMDSNSGLPREKLLEGAVILVTVVTVYILCWSPTIIRHSAVQCSAVQCSAVQCSAVQCSAVQCSAVQCSAVH